LASVVNFGHHHVTGLIQTEKDAPFADTQAVPAFQRTLQCLNVAAAGCGKRFQAANNAFRSERSMRLRERSAAGR
jgi:hypothetical protein